MKWIDEYYALCLIHNRVIMPYWNQTDGKVGIGFWDVNSQNGVDVYFDHNRERIGTPGPMKTYSTMRAAKKRALKRAKNEGKSMAIVLNTRFNDLVVRAAPYYGKGSLVVVALCEKDNNNEWKIQEHEHLIPETMQV